MHKIPGTACLSGSSEHCENHSNMCMSKIHKCLDGWHVFSSSHFYYKVSWAAIPLKCCKHLSVLVLTDHGCSSSGSTLSNRREIGKKNNQTNALNNWTSKYSKVQSLWRLYTTHACAYPLEMMVHKCCILLYYSCQNACDTIEWSGCSAHFLVKVTCSKIHANRPIIHQL